MLHLFSTPLLWIQRFEFLKGIFETVLAIFEYVLIDVLASFIFFHLGIFWVCVSYATLLIQFSGKAEYK